MKLSISKRLPEANVQAEFYMKCRELGIPCILEYRAKGSRFDAVIHRDGEAICIVEIKNMSEKAIRRRATGLRKYKQIERYEKFGVPVIFLGNMRCVEQVISQVARLYHG